MAGEVSIVVRFSERCAVLEELRVLLDRAPAMLPPWATERIGEQILAHETDGDFLVQRDTGSGIELTPSVSLEALIAQVYRLTADLEALYAKHADLLGPIPESPVET